MITTANDSKMKFSWNNTSQKPRIIVSAEEDDDYDTTAVQHWKEEGFQVSYLPLASNKKFFVQQLHDYADRLELGEKYGIVGQASPCLGFGLRVIRIMLIRSVWPKHMAKLPKPFLKSPTSLSRSYAPWLPIIRNMCLGREQDIRRV